MNTNDRKQLTRDDILGRKMITVYEEKGSRVGRFKNSLTFVHLDNGTIFNLDELRDPEKDQPLTISSCGYKKTFVPVLSIHCCPTGLRVEV
jgi:hypothetical protein